MHLTFKLTNSPNVNEKNGDLRAVFTSCQTRSKLSTASHLIGSPLVHQEDVMGQI